MNQWSRPTSTQIRPILQFSAKQSILSKSQRHPILRRKVASIEMPCMKCGAEMRLAMIEPRDQNYDVLTYRCTPCDSGECFLKAR